LIGFAQICALRTAVTRNFWGSGPLLDGMTTKKFCNAERRFNRSEQVSLIEEPSWKRQKTILNSFEIKILSNE
jgi:hypothetical protein